MKHYVKCPPKIVLRDFTTIILFFFLFFFFSGEENLKGVMNKIVVV